MYSEGVCDQVAKFYIEWAWELEQVNNFKKAEQVFNNSMKKVTDVEDQELLKSKHKQFQTRVMKRMLETSDSNDADQDQPGGGEDQRTALSSLRSQGKKGKVGSVRVGAAKVSETPGVLMSSGQVPKSSNSSSSQLF